MAKKAKTLDVVCVGNVVVDAVGVYVDKIPDEGSLALFDRVEMHMGGCANNTALALAKMGLNVGLAAKVGQDGLGEFAASELSRHGVDIRGLKRSPADSTSFSFIMVPKNGNRRILHTLAANASFGPKDIDPALFKGAKWVCFGGLAIIPSLEGRNLASVMKTIRKAGAYIAADTAINNRFTPADWNRMLAPCYEYIDILFPSEVEAQAITGERDPEKICATLRKRGVRVAGVKLGERGSALMTDEGYFEIPVYNVKCVDTLGAGDCFMAGLIAGMLRGLSPVEAAKLGNAVSAHCVQAVGATTGIKPISKILAFQKTQASRMKTYQAAAAR
ncbi:MAG TPA: carbohydrate kinase family protein [Planctomycetota bacterium]|nr:carbohydrate kinase family protein [Planctomycetota bacterium]